MKKKIALGEYQSAFKNFLKDELKDEKTLNTDIIRGKKRDELIRWHYYNMNRFNKLFCSNSSHYQTLFFMQKNNKFHIFQSFEENHKIVVSHSYHENVGKKPQLYRQILRKWYFYKLPNSVFNYNSKIYDFYLPKRISNEDPFQRIIIS